MSSVQVTREHVAEGVPEEIIQELVTFVGANSNQSDAIVSFINNTIRNITAGSNKHSLQALCFVLYYGPAALQTSRVAFSHLTNSILALDDELFSDMATFMLSVHQIPNNSRVFSFESILVPVRERLVVIYEQRGKWREAAEVLVRIPPESSVMAIPEQAFRYNIRTTHLFIAAGFVDRAETYLNRSTAQLSSCNDDGLRLHYRICHARILDLKGRFEDAAHRYYVLANDSQTVDLVDSMTDTHVPALVHAVTCAILAKAGPRRSRLLAMLHSDERSRRLDIFPLLESIHMGRLLSKEQVDGFRPTLQAHQLRQTKDGEDGDIVLDQAVIEHNVLAVSRMYNNIGLDQLGALLNVTAEKAEKTARVMISEKRMHASIDQVERVVEFSNKCTTSKIENWDALIASLCGQVDDCVEAIIDKFPQFASQL